MRFALIAGAIAFGAVACVDYLDRNYGHQPGAASSTDAADAGGIDAASCAEGAYACHVIADRPLSYLRFGESTVSLPVRDETGACSGSYPESGIALDEPSPVGSAADHAIRVEPLSYGVRMRPCVVDVTSRPSLAFSIELWVNGSATEDVALLVDHEDWRETRTGWAITLVEGVPRLELWNGGSSVTSVEGAAPLTAGSWHHCVFTFDGSNGRAVAWVDGAPAPKAVPSGTRLPPVSDGWAIGSQNCSTCASAYRGALDELAIYDRVLGEREVLAHLQMAR